MSSRETLLRVRRLCHIACSSRCVDQKRKGLHEHLLEKRLHWSVSRREEQLARIDLGETVPFDIALPLPARDERPGSDSGVRLFWERFTCQRCGRCCYTPGAGLYLEKEEFERIAGFLGSKRRLKALCRRDGATGAWILRQPCPFYDEGLRACRIYEIRPATCAKYPLHPPLEDMPYNLAVDAFCPAARSFVKETLGWWIICEDNWARLLAMSGP